MLLDFQLSSSRGGGGEVQAVCSLVSLSVVALTETFLHVILFL